MMVPDLSAFPRRQRQMVEAMLAGESCKVTARRLAIAPGAVIVHRSRAMRRVGARNPAHLIAILCGAAREIAR